MTTFTTITVSSKEYKDYEKTKKVILSCETIDQLNSARKMVLFFGENYSFDEYYIKLFKLVQYVYNQKYLKHKVIL